MKKNGLSDAQRKIAALFATPATLYNPGLTIMFGALPVGVMLSQLLYWEGKQSDKNGFIYKTAKELYEETGLTSTQQTRARNVLIKYKVISHKVARTPATNHYKLNLQILCFIITRFKEIGKLVSIDEVIQYERNVKTITENTQKDYFKKYPREYPPRVKRAASLSAKKQSSSIGITSTIA